MGCSISNNIVAPDPSGLPLNHRDQQGQLKKTALSPIKSAGETGSMRANTVHINDILIDKTMRHNFADYVRHEKEVVESELHLTNETEEEEMRRLINELILCYRNVGNEELEDLEVSPKDDTTANTPITNTSNVKNQPVQPSQESGRAKNELLLLLAASNLPNFSRSDAFRDSEMSRNFNLGYGQDAKDPS